MQFDYTILTIGVDRGLEGVPWLSWQENRRILQTSSPMEKAAYQQTSWKGLRLFHTNYVNMIPLVTVLQHLLKRQKTEKGSRILDLLNLSACLLQCKIPWGGSWKNNTWFLRANVNPARRGHQTPQECLKIDFLTKGKKQFYGSPTCALETHHLRTEHHFNTDYRKRPLRYHPEMPPKTQISFQIDFLHLRY